MTAISLLTRHVEAQREARTEILPMRVVAQRGQEVMVETTGCATRILVLGDPRQTHPPAKPVFVARPRGGTGSQEQAVIISPVRRALGTGAVFPIETRDPQAADLAAIEPSIVYASPPYVWPGFSSRHVVAGHDFDRGLPGTAFSTEEEPVGFDRFQIMRLNISGTVYEVDPRFAISDFEHVLDVEAGALGLNAVAMTIAVSASVPIGTVIAMSVERKP